MITKPVVFDEEFDEVDPLITAVISARWRIDTQGHVTAGHFVAIHRSIQAGRVGRNWWSVVGDRLDDVYLDARDKLHDELRACCRALTGKYSGRYRFGNYLVDIGTPSRLDESCNWPDLFYDSDLAIYRIPSNWRPA